ncbi:MAG: hypothetical protein K2H52_18405 [Lachnospiraceae bacterium]|nr:hypothetical protein [Lachnospiraceae bacterium]MDE6184601.1 hypothetical protein [Lachnospiraceae bacterium]MDE7285318.1 hypothetical protein [Lachnospiraceae bacterium]
MSYKDFVPITGTIVNITRGNDCCSQMVMLRSDDGIVNFVVSAQTQVIDDIQLRVGMRVAAFYDASQPMPLIFPPQYRAQLVTVIGRNEQVMLNHFDRNLLAADRSLQLNIAGNTMIRTANGQRFDCNPANQTMLVYYSVTTRSIPPQTTPSRVIVFC